MLKRYPGRAERDPGSGAIRDDTTLISYKRIDLRIIGKMSRHALGKFHDAIDGNLEHAATAAHQFDFRSLGVMQQTGLHTEGFGFVVSDAAIADCDFHGAAPCR